MFDAICLMLSTCLRSRLLQGISSIFKAPQQLKKLKPPNRNMSIRRIMNRHFARGTYAAGWGQGAIDVEKNDGVLDWAGLEWRINCCCFGHDCGCGVGWDVVGGFGAWS